MKLFQNMKNLELLKNDNIIYHITPFQLSDNSIKGIKLYELEHKIKCIIQYLINKLS